MKRSKGEPPRPPQPPLPTGARSGQADLRPNQLQDLADVLGAIRTRAAGYDLKFTVRIQVGGGAVGTVPDDVIAGVNEVLTPIERDLEIK